MSQLSHTPFAVLDLAPMRDDDAGPGPALRRSLDLARHVERLGFSRLWVAEHHNMEGIASSATAVLLGYLAANTSSLRLGSGGVMLPNHSPLAVAEQFALLAAVYGDRVDLGIGRAPGTDQLTSAAIRGQLRGGHYVDSSGRPADVLRDFPQHVQDIKALLSRDGAVLSLPLGRTYRLRPAPDVQHPPQMWLLGSSDYSAELAADLGLPYVFAHHFSGIGTQRALELYRRGFRRPEGDEGTSPRTFISVNVSVADTTEEAWELAEPHMLAMARLRTGGALGKARFVGRDVRSALSPDLRDTVAPIVESWAIGNPSQVADQLRETAARFDVDEIMVHPIQGARESDPADSWPARIRGLELLAEALL